MCGVCVLFFKCDQNVIKLNKKVVKKENKQQFKQKLCGMYDKYISVKHI